MTIKTGFCSYAPAIKSIILSILLPLTKLYGGDEW